MPDWRQALHLEPPRGWLNDPNGLCCFGGLYHVFFQYCPADARGAGPKLWGHYQSPDLLHWTFTGAPLAPDTPWDEGGVYSGCAVAEGGVMRLYYTGNVKHPGAHDYIHTGREANTLLVETADGVHVSPKKLLMTNADYPADCSLHVRDPKVWREDGLWKMVLGARSLADAGRVLVNDKPAKASYAVKVGDVIEITFGNRPVKVRVLAVEEPKGKDVARELFEVIAQ